MNAKVIVMPKAAVLDPQGNAVRDAMRHLGMPEVRSVRIGKYMEIEIEGKDGELESRLHQLSRARVADYCVHNRRKTSDGSTAKVIAVRKSPGQHDCIESIERSFLVPDVLSFQSVEPINRCNTILVAVGTGKLNDGKVHRDFNACVRVAPRGNRSPPDMHG